MTAGTKGGALRELRTRVLPEAEEALACLIENLCGEPPVAYRPLEAERIELSIYEPGARPWSGRRRQQWLGLFDQLRGYGLEPGPANLEVRRVRAEDWKESWKRHFPPLDISDRLLVLPSWSRRKVRPGQVRIVLDPGLSFGTGQHPTTRYCLEEVSRLVTPDTRVLDAGAGSGILALAAAALGARRVEGFDFDACAVDAARANARLNLLAERIQWSCRDLLKMKPAARPGFQLIAANLMPDLLEAGADRLVSRLHPGGHLLVAGILEKQFPGLERRLKSHGLKRVRDCLEGEWRSGTFRLKTG